MSVKNLKISEYLMAHFWCFLEGDISQLYYIFVHNDIIYKILSRICRWAGHVARMGDGRGVYRVLVEKPEGKRPLRRRGRRWEDNIKKDLQEVGCEGMDWIELAQDRGRWGGICECGIEPPGCIKFGEFLD